jgi:iron(III) transport system permease protein
MLRLSARPLASSPFGVRATTLGGAHLLVVTAFVCILVGLPVLSVLVNSFNTAVIGQPPVYGFQNWSAALGDALVMQALWNSLLLGATRTLIALPIAALFAWLIARTDMPGRNLLEACCWLGVFMPQLPLAFGWILLLDPQSGLVNTAIASAVGQRPFNIYSFWGITWVHLASSAIYFKVLLLLPFFRRMSPILEETAYASGASYLTSLARITLPLLAPALLSVGFLGFVKSLEVFEVEMLLGLPAKIYVYSTLIYDFTHHVPPQYGAATVLGLIFLVTLLGLAIFQQSYLARRQFLTITGKPFRPRVLGLGRLRYVMAGLCFAYIAVGLALPAAFLVLGSFMRRFGFFGLRDPFTAEHWQSLFTDPVFFSSLENTAVMAVCTAVLVVLTYSIVAYVIVRERGWLIRVIDLIAWLPWAVPGILLSLAMLWLVLATPLKGVLFGSLAGIVLALVIKDSPVSTQMFRAAFLQVGRELEESASLSGAAWGKIYVRILLPLIAPTVFTVGLLTLMSAAKEISTPALLYTGTTRPVSLLMLEYGLNGFFERAAALGVLMAAAVMLILFVSTRLGHQFGLEGR